MGRSGYYEVIQENKRKVTMIELNPELNPKLSALIGIRYSKGYTPIPNSSLPKSLFSALDTVHKGLTGEPLDPKDNTILIRAINGAYKRAYTPKLYKQGDQLVIRWGSKVIPLKVNKGEIASTVDNSEVSLFFGLHDFGYEPEIALSIDCENQDETVLTIPVGLTEGSELTLTEAQKAVKKGDIKTLLDKIMEAPANSGSYGEGLEVRKLVDLEEGKPYKVIGYRLLSFDNRKSSLLKVSQDRTDYTPAELFEVWGNSRITALLCSEPAPVINGDHPAWLTVTDFKEKNNRTSCNAHLELTCIQSKGEDDLNLDFLEAFGSGDAFKLGSVTEDLIDLSDIPY